MLIRTPTRSVGVAPWRSRFVQHVTGAPLCAVSTIHGSGSESESGSESAERTGSPRVRTCVFRGMWGTRPDNAHNVAPGNPRVYESDLPVFTTDARMAKAGELAGGGPIEMAWWVAEAGTQWRVRGRAWMLGADADGPGDAAARRAIAARMRRVSGSAAEGAAEGAADGWSWSREVTMHFGNISPALRGGFRSPAPGTPRPAPRPGAGTGRGAPVGDDDLENAEARANFRVVVVVPEAVDEVRLASGDDRRYVHTYVGADGGWETVEVWP